MLLLSLHGLQPETRLRTHETHTQLRMAQFPFRQRLSWAWHLMWSKAQPKHQAVEGEGQNSACLVGASFELTLGFFCESGLAF